MKYIVKRTPSCPEGRAFIVAAHDGNGIVLLPQDVSDDVLKGIEELVEKHNDALRFLELAAKAPLN